MKILYLITKSEVGGAQTHVAQLCEYMAARGHKIAVMSCPGGWLEQSAKNFGCIFEPNKYFSNSFNPLSALKAIVKIKEFINDFKSDIIHCHSSGAAAFGRLAIRGRVPTIYTAHGWGFNVGVPWPQKIIAILVEKFLASYANKIICVSKFVKNLAIRYHIATDSKFTIIYNGVEDLKLFTDSSEKIRIVFIGRLSEPKQPLMLLEAFEKLSDNTKNKCEIIIIGDGPKRVTLVDFIEKHHLSGVNFFGGLTREETLKILATSDIFVMISKWEGLPITILEAMSAGLPIIASDVGGINEAITDDCGMLVRVGDIAGLLSALENLINNKTLRRQLGEIAAIRAREKFSLDKMCHETEKVYEEVLNKHTILI